MNRGERRRSARRARQGGGKVEAASVDERDLIDGVRCLKQGRLDDARAVFDDLLKRAPGHPEVQHLAGLCAHQQGNFPDAVRHLVLATKIAPRNPQYQYNLGEALRLSDQFAEAEAAYRRALELAPKVANIHFSLGNVHLAQDRHEDAAKCFSRAVALNPDDPEYRLNLGVAQEALEDTDAALASYDAALAVDPKFADGHVNRGALLRQLGRSAEAIASFHRALAIAPDLAAAHLKLGATLQELGRFEDAGRAFERVLAVDPDNANARYCLVNNETTNPGTSEIADLERILALPKTEAQDRVDLGFAAGKMCENMGLFDRAFAFYKLANETIRQSGLWDSSEFVDVVDAVIDAFDKPLFDRQMGAGVASSLPVFIVGMPRSGTTLVEQILASHPEVHGAGERYEINRLAMKTLRRGAFEKSPYPGGIGNADPAALRALAEAHLTALSGLAPEAARITDKMPANFRHLGLIALLFPGATIIHCRRDPMDTCFSCYTQNFATGQNYSHSFAYLGVYYRQYQRLMAHWRQVLPIDMLAIDYEKLVADQEAESRRLVAHCGLDWDPRCLAFERTERSVMTASFRQVREPLYASSVGRWRRFETHLGPLQKALGI